MQNNGHIEALKQRLKDFADVPFYSVIVFYGNCVLKNVSYIPDEVSYGGPESVPKIVNVILASSTSANYASKIGVVNTLKEAVLNGEDEEIQSAAYQKRSICDTNSVDRSIQKVLGIIPKTFLFWGSRYCCSLNSLYNSNRLPA